MTVEMIARTYLDPYQTRGYRFTLQRHGWYEYGNYVGAAAVLLVGASVCWALLGSGRERWLGGSLAVTTLILLALSAGEFHPWAPASIANHVPLFSSFRIPSRYTMVFVLCGVATAGWALARLTDQAALSPPVRQFLTILCVLAALDVAVRNRQQLAGVFSEPASG